MSLLKWEILNPILYELISQLSINKGSMTTRDVMARYIDNNHILYLNLSNETKEIEMKTPSKSILWDRAYTGNFKIAPNEPEFIEIKE